MSKYLVVLLAGCACACLSACGMKGELERPPTPAPEPLLGKLKPAVKSAPAKPAAPPAQDVSTDPNRSSP